MLTLCVVFCIAYSATRKIVCLLLMRLGGMDSWQKR